MRFSVALAALPALAASVFAQSQDHQVMVGMGGQLAFTPSSVNASAGDTVTFVFNPKNHTVTQSTFATPCTKMPNGIASGFQPVQAGAANVPAMTIQINDTTPLWFYCGQTSPVSHCGNGMVFAVNPTADKSFEAFQTAANATLASANSTSTGTSSSSASASSATGTTGGTGSTGTTGSTGSTGTAGSTGSTGANTSSGTTGAGAASPSASTTGANTSSALGLSARAAPLLAALGIAAGLFL